LSLSLWIPEEGEGETNLFLLIFRGHRDYPHCNSHSHCKGALRPKRTDVVRFGMEWKEERWMLATAKGRE